MGRPQEETSQFSICEDAGGIYTISDSEGRNIVITIEEIVSDSLEHRKQKGLHVLYNAGRSSKVMLTDDEYDKFIAAIL